jgi:formylglycine-generating enzyme required for sulfatase activity
LLLTFFVTSKIIFIFAAKKAMKQSENLFKEQIIMRKKYFYFLTALLMAACTYIISPDKDDEPSVSELVSTQSISAGSNAGTYSFDIRSNISWIIATDQSWCTVSPASGKGNMTISVNLTQNTSAQPRTATISVRVGNLTATITVTQSGSAALVNLTVSPMSYNLAADGGTSEAFTVTSNQTWTVTSNASWLTVSKSSGSNNSTFKVTAYANASTVQRTAAVTVSGGGITRKITVTQDGQPVTPLSADMVFVKGGTFVMGCTDEQGSDCYGVEKPAHQVTLNSFYISKYEVTQKEWLDIMGKSVSQIASENAGGTYGVGDKYPMYFVSWTDIVGNYGTTQIINGITYYSNGFIYKLNQKTGQKYRLPTEAEWEYAARGGAVSKGYKYSGSNTLGNVAWYVENSSGKTHPVGSKQANELGIFDMSGNVWEWCADWYGDYSNSAQSNPTGPETGTFRVFRGGGWLNSAGSTRVSYRYIYPDYSYHYIGFRLACDQ